MRDDVLSNQRTIDVNLSNVKIWVSRRQNGGDECRSIFRGDEGRSIFRGRISQVFTYELVCRKGTINKQSQDT